MKVRSLVEGQLNAVFNKVIRSDEVFTIDPPTYRVDRRIAPMLGCLGRIGVMRMMHEEMIGAYKDD